MSPLPAPRLASLLVRRSGAGLTVTGRDDGGLEHKFTGAEEMSLNDGELTVVHKGQVYRFRIAQTVEA